MKYIFKSFNFGIITHRDAEAMLNNMANRGYELKGLCKGYLKGIALFERNEKAKELTYAVDTKHGLSEEETKELCSFYGDMGWEYKDNHRKKLYVFVSSDKNPPPLYTDEYSKYEVFAEAMRKDGEPYGNIAVATFFSITAWIFLKLGDVFDNNLLRYSFFIFFSIMAVAGAILAIDAFLYRARCTRKTERGEAIPQPKLRGEMSKWETCFSWTVLAIAPLLEICACIYLIWGRAVELTGSTERTILILFIFWSALSIPLLLWSSMKSCLFPEKKYWSVGSFVIGFLFYFNIYFFLNFYIMREIF